jgi:hypothetical protein
LGVGLIEGHTTLTENFTIEALAGLEPALTELHEFALARMGENMPLPHICRRLPTRESSPTSDSVASAP